MSEQLKQELEADTDHLEAETVAGSETIGEQEEKPAEGKLEAQEGDESKEEDTVPMGKASLVDIVSGITAPTKEEVEAAEELCGSGHYLPDEKMRRGSGAC